MIKEIKISNFYSFGNETITLQPDVNILIGVNGSGKSNFLKAIKLLQEGISGRGLRTHIFDNLGGFDNIFFKGNTNADDSSAITIEYTLDGQVIAKGNYGYSFTHDLVYRIKIIKSPGLQNYYIHEHIESLKNTSNSSGFVYLDFTNGIGVLNELIEEKPQKTGLVKYTDFNGQELALKEVSDTNRYLSLTAVKKALKDIVVYDYFDTTPKSPIRKATLATSDLRLNADGTNLPQILNTIKINSKPSFRKITEMLGEVNQNFIGLDYHIMGGSNIELMLEEKELNSSVHVSNFSDGTLRYLCLLAILYNPEKGKLICIDEPEVGLHPDMIRNVADAIKYAAKDATIVVSTHSVGLLDIFSLENVCVFEKDETNATRVHKYGEEQFSGWYEHFSPGRMWVAGDLGGVRYGG